MSAKKNPVNIYDIDKIDVEKMTKNLISKGFNENDIRKAIYTATQYSKKNRKVSPQLMENKVKDVKITSDHQPCSDCGGIFFLRTGTCHVCQTCGASQGCS